MQQNEENTVSTALSTSESSDIPVSQMDPGAPGKGTNQGRPLVGIQPDDAQRLEARMAELQLVPTSIKMYTGHTVYESLNGSGNYIISGQMLVRYVNGNIEPSLYDFLREECGVRRIRIHEDEPSASNAMRLQSEGQALLNGTAQAIPRAVILNGALVEGAEYHIDHEERLLVPVEPLFEAYSYNAGFHPSVGAVVSYNHTGYFFPARNTSIEYQETYAVAGGQWKYTNSDPANFWTDTFDCIWDGGLIEMETLCRILGWTYHFKNDMLVVLSCEEDLDPLHVSVPPAPFSDFDVYYPEDISLIPDAQALSETNDESGIVPASNDEHDTGNLSPSGEG